ncbi:protoporphyrinogen oxidase [Opitutales bacterium]|nr:protoporphyrinogen oxidase [Opitutales bacterium]
MSRTCIIGGGLTGLVQAWQSQQAGHKVTLFEANDTVGGVLQSERIDGYLLDYGANTLSLRHQKVARILGELGMLDRSIDANPEASLRFIVRSGKVVSLPHNLGSFFSSPFLSPLGKLRLLLEPFIPKGKEDEESVAGFISRRLGKEALDFAGNPFLSGVYAAKPESLSLKYAFPALQEIEQKHGSLFRGMLKSKKNPERLSKSRLISFASGMQEMPNRILDLLPAECVQFKTRAIKIEKVNNQWKVTSQSKGSQKTKETFDQLICAVPASKLLDIEWKGLVSKELLPILAEATHHPLSLVYHGYDRAKVNHPLDGFGFLVPEVEKRNILGTLFSSTLFPGRAPENKVLLTTFVGGERQPKLANLEDSKLHSLVLKEHQQLLGTQGRPCFQKIKRWPNAIPLPDAKMGDRQSAARDLQEGNNGLYFTGSHLCGVSLPNCLEADID